MSKPSVCGWVLVVVLGVFGSTAVRAEQVPTAEADGSRGQASEARNKGLGALTPSRRARLEAGDAEFSEERFGDPDLAEQFYVNSRLGPLRTRGPNPTVGTGTISPDLYFPALKHIRSMPRFSSARNAPHPSLAAQSTAQFDPFAATPPEAVGTWTNLGPSNQGGRTRALLIDPVNPNILYAGGVAGGVWKSTDGGASWMALTDQMANLAVVALAFDPSNSGILYAGTGEGYGNSDAIRGAGIFKSTNAGASWSQLASTDNANFHYSMAIRVSPRNPQRVWAATRTGIFRSLDAGSSWTQVIDASAVGGCTELAIQMQGSSGFVFASCGRTSSQGTVYRGDDTDSSTLSSVLSLSGQGRSSIAIAPSDESVVYVMASQRNSGGGPGQYGLHGIYRSASSGASGSFVTQRQGNVAPANTAQKINQLLLSNPVIALLTECGLGTSSFANQGWYDNVLAVDPLDPNIVWAGGVDLWRSDNAGVDWGTASYWWFDKGIDPEYHHADQHGIVFHPQYNGTSNRIVFATSDGGVERTDNARAPVNTTLAQICGNPVSNGTAWIDRNTGYVTSQFYDGAVYPNGMTYFGGLQDNGTQRGNSSSSDWSILIGGDGGYAAVNTLDDSDPANDVLFAENTGKSLQRSTNGGATFISVSGTITGTGFLFIAPFAMNEGNRQQIWTGGFDIWRSTNQGTTWARATGSSGTCGAGSISAFATHPLDGNRVLVGMSDGCFHYNTAALSAPNTGTWPGGGTLASGFISSMAWDPTNVNVAYATVSAFGIPSVYKTTTGGFDWSPSVGSGATSIPQIPALSVVVNPNDSQQVFVGTDLGVFTSIDGGVNWNVENSGFARTPVESLKVDQNGTRLFAFTHGRGVWSTRICNPCLNSVGGTVNGLAPGNTVTLRNNGGDDLLVPADGSFLFPAPVIDGGPYAVSVFTQPTTPNQTCVVSNGNGTIAGVDIADVAVVCSINTYLVGGTVAGLAAGASVSVQNNGGDMQVLASNAAFNFPTALPDESSYAVTISAQPAAGFQQVCWVNQGSGVLAGANINSVRIQCVNLSDLIFRDGFD